MSLNKIFLRYQTQSATLCTQGATIEMQYLSPFQLTNNISEEAQRPTNPYAVHNMISWPHQVFRAHFRGGSEAHKTQSLHISNVTALPSFLDHTLEEAQRPTDPNAVYHVTSPTVMSVFQRGPRGPKTHRQCMIWPLQLLRAHFRGGSEAHKPTGSVWSDLSNC